MSEQKQQPEQGPRNLTLTISLTFLGDEEPMVATRATVDGKQEVVPFFLVLGANAGHTIGGLPPIPELHAVYATALLRGSVTLAGQLVKEAKAVASKGAPAQTPPAA